MSTLLSTLLQTDHTKWLDPLTAAIKNVLSPILILVAFAGIIYAIVVGVQFAKADDKSQREEAKQKLITVIVGIVVTAVLIALFFWLAESLDNGGWIYNLLNKTPDAPAPNPDTNGDSGSNVLISFFTR